MASSSSQKSHKLKVKGDEEGDWLELGLGIGFRRACRKEEDQGSHPPVSKPLPIATSFAASSSSSLPLQTNQLGLGLELKASGLALRFDNEGVRHVDIMAPPSSNYHNLLLWPDNCHHYHDNNDEDVEIDVYNGLPESSSSWPWHMDSGAAFLGLHDCPVPVPNDSHHYDSSTTRPHPGFWFTLRSLTNRDGEVLPQIPKAYIRVKDENVTVFMVKKYLVTKLGLSNEAEVMESSLGF
ncbi:uncharacterized protein LOC115965690 isoform X2 [Quercus lobata]|uniref:uncharacterized protein LOC115965690 isoform X2 n=1 Tax=Quercus lobata TaxID=97700 RepID=UPI001248BFA1|nr:uncharacterized protein LOC115965690 isoform X2 [Quercus lobata]